MPRFFCFWLALVTLPCLRVTAQPQTIAVVNMVPQSNSGETYQDSEASLAINPANPAQMAATAITTDPRYGSKGPIYFSLNGGSAWGIVAIVPSVSGSPFPYVDATVDFGASNTLYAAILKSQGAGQPMPLSILKAPNFPSVSVMTEMPGSGRQDVDQPHLHAAIINTGSSRRDLIFVGDDDYDIDPLFLGRTAAIDQFNQTAFVPTMIESRGTSDRDGAPIRVAIHPNQTVYGAFLARRSISGTGTGQYFNTDLILVCDRASGTGLRTFKALTDSDGKSGKLVVTGTRVPVTLSIGQERVGYDLAIATDPRNSNTVYLAWADLRSGVYTLHLRRYTTGPVWSGTGDLGPGRINAKNPALAINSNGTVLFFYQQLTGSGSNQTWETRIERSDDGYNTPVTPIVLSKWKLNDPSMTYLPFLGDYASVLAVGNNFYGVFSASNYPDQANFPHGVTYHRRVNWTTHTLIATNGTTVPVSLDPFFFRLLIP